MKKCVCLFGAVLVAAVLTGCTTYYRDSVADYLARPELESTTPYYTDFDIKKERISAKGEAAVLFGIFQIAENKRCQSVINPNLSVFSVLDELLSPTYKAVSNAKSIALYNACEQYDADQLMGATFDYVITNYLFYAKVDCVVKGFPAKVKGIKMIDRKPVILNQWQRIEYIKPYEIPVNLSGTAQPESLSLSVDGK